MFSELMDMAYGTNSNLGNLRITTLFGPSALPLSKWETFTNKNAKDGKSSRGLTKAEMQSVLDGLAPFVSMMIDS